MDAITAFQVFALTALVDIMWVRCVRAAAKRQPFKAAVWSLFLFLLGSYVTRHYVEDSAMIWPAAIGAFVGAYVALL